jgi:hypothetical protein
MNPAATYQGLEGLSQQRSIYWHSRVDKLGAPSLSWLVVAPVWTDALARETSFPSGSLSLDDLLSECEAMGWCERRATKASHRTPSEGAKLLAEAAMAILRTPSEDTPRIVREVLERLKGFPQEPSVVVVSAKLRREAVQAGLTGIAARFQRTRAGRCHQAWLRKMPPAASPMRRLPAPGRNHCPFWSSETPTACSANNSPTW